MIEETATVTASAGEYAQVETQRQTACGACQVKSACGTSLLAKALGARRTSVRVLNKIGARPGDRVIVGIDESMLTRVSFIFYISPLLGLILGAAAGDWLAGQRGLAATEPFSIAGGLVGLVMGLVWLRRYTAGSARNGQPQAVILRLADTVTVGFRHNADNRLNIQE